MLRITQSVQDQSVTLLLSGRFDFQARKAFQTAIAQAQSTDPREIILNFTDVPFLDSSALGLLMLVKKNWPDPNCQLRLAVPPGYVMNVLTLASMEKHFCISALEQVAP